MSITLSKGTILNAFQGKRVYQPVWQVLYLHEPPDSNVQLLFSDGQYVSYNVALHPYCQITYNKTQWKIQNNRGAPGPAKVLNSYRFPVIKVIESMMKAGDRTQVLFLSKIKLMDFARDPTGPPPEILSRPSVQVVSGEGGLVWRARELLDQFDGPRLDVSCVGGGGGGLYDSDSDSGGGGTADFKYYFDDNYTRRKQILSEKKSKPTKFYTDQDLLTGELAFLGPEGLDVLRICNKCQLLAYQTQSRTASFTPPVRNLASELSSMKLVSGENDLQFCLCNDEKEQFRKEFQSKCMVVNQEQGNGSAGGGGGGGGNQGGKVQCILISRGQQEEQGIGGDCKHKTGAKKEEGYSKKGLEYDSDCVKGGNGRSTKLQNGKTAARSSVLPFHSPREAVVSAIPRICERCGVEDVHMSSCRQCQKVFYCSPPCKRADVKDHATVCRAFITVRRYGEERSEFALRLREPEDGCETCGFWRDSLEDCQLCGEVGFCCSKCREKGEEKHKPVCEAFRLIQVYKQKQTSVRSLEID